MKSDNKILDMNIDLDFIFINFTANDDMEVIRKMAENLNAKGVVKDSFVPAILERERNFCTGLQFDEAGIAIPHTDTQHVNIPAISIAVLNNPIIFQGMGMPGTKVNVEIVFMLAIKEAHSHMEFLQTLMTEFQREGVLRNLITSKSKTALLHTFNMLFSK
ncbi:PTS sugar transporter subunit IIA [Anaerosinus massiliensis]|uniref:PTS sugar transporter subunit IIA n=1 Tax=Massilibacillus massiliensis TaxID=1806837 RepID=UPI000DA612D7|nr:PTS sugar transporter subunit IIA [Massilibacillus massiliensis]